MNKLFYLVTVVIILVACNDVSVNSSLDSLLEKEINYIGETLEAISVVELTIIDIKNVSQAKKSSADNILQFDLDDANYKFFNKYVNQVKLRNSELFLCVDDLDDVKFVNELSDDEYYYLNGCFKQAIIEDDIVIEALDEVTKLLDEGAIENKTYDMLEEYILITN